MPFSLIHILTRLALLTGVGANLAHARVDELHFPNGDRVTGTLVRETETAIVFQSAAMGELTVPKEQVRVVTREAADPSPGEAPPKIAPRAEASESSADPAASPRRKPSTEKPPGSEAERMAENLAVTEPWQGEMEFGLRQQEGRKELLNFDLRGAARRTIGDNDFQAKARLRYGEQNNEVSNHRYAASFLWRHELSKRTFAQSQTSYFQDEVKDIKLNLEQNVGAGFRLYESGTHVINLGAGLTEQYREATLSDSGFDTLIEVFQDYTYRINPNLTIRQNMQTQYSPDGGVRARTGNTPPSSGDEKIANYKVRFNTVLQRNITKDLSLNLRFEFEYDNAVQSSEARTDQLIISSLGYSF